MSLDEQSHAFVVKIWHERRDLAGAASVWRGSVDDVRGGPRVYFDSLATLCRYLVRHAELGDDAIDRIDRDEDRRAPRPH